MNITAGLPGGARLNPLVAGGFSGANFGVWLTGYFLFDEKMITLFSMLFGAGLVLGTDRAEQSGRAPSAFFYRRAATLLLIGLAHAYLLWEGDILVTYALCSLAIYPLRRKSPRKLLLIAALLWLIVLPLQIGFAEAVNQSRLAATGSGQAELWKGMRMSFQPTEAEIERQIAERLSESYPQSIVRRAPEALSVHTVLFAASLFWTVSARMLVGMALMKLGFFSSAWQNSDYLRMAIGGYAVGMPIVAIAAYLQIQHGFDIVFLFGRTFLLNAFGSIFVALGHASLLLWLRQRATVGLARLAAVGRMALSNYLMHSLICTFLFYSYGLGLFGGLNKVELFGVVLAIWAVQLWYSPIWLRYFRFGPAEWLWRTLAYGTWQPFRV